MNTVKTIASIFSKSINSQATVESENQEVRSLTGLELRAVAGGGGALAVRVIEGFSSE